MKCLDERSARGSLRVPRCTESTDVNNASRRARGWPADGFSITTTHMSTVFMRALINFQPEGLQSKNSLNTPMDLRIYATTLRPHVPQTCPQFKVISDSDNKTKQQTFLSLLPTIRGFQICWLLMFSSNAPDARPVSLDNLEFSAQLSRKILRLTQV